MLTTPEDHMSQLYEDIDNLVAQRDRYCTYAAVVSLMLVLSICGGLSILSMWHHHHTDMTFKHRQSVLDVVHTMRSKGWHNAADEVLYALPASEDTP